MNLDDTFTLFAAMAIALLSFGAVFRHIIAARLFEDLPESRIRSAAQGYVKLHGFASAGEGGPQITGVSGLPCLWYQSRIEHLRSDGWKDVETDAGGGLILLSDDTGECNLDPAYADITTGSVMRWYGNSATPRAGSWQAPGWQIFMRLKGFLGIGNLYRYSEERIEAGDYLYVIGNFETVSATSREELTQDKTREILRAWKADRNRLLARFDLNGDGEIDMQEWERARHEAAEEASAYVLETSEDKPPVNLIARSPRSRQPFLISSKDPGRLPRHYRIKAFFEALVFLAAAVFSVVGIYSRFG